MKTLLLLGGQSKRFWPLKEKPLFSICGSALVERQVQRLQAGSCSDILIVASRENLPVIAALLPDVPTVQQPDDIHGMHGALLAALPECGSEPVLVVSGNDFIEPAAYKDLSNQIKNDGVDGAILGQEVDTYFPGGYLTVEGTKVTGIIEKPGEANVPSNYVNIVAHAHKNAAGLLEAIKATDQAGDDVYERALDSLFQSKNYQLAPYRGHWQAVKYPWHLLDLLEMFLDEIIEPQIHPSAEIHPSAVVEGNVIIKEGVKIFPHATVRGPCYIGKRSVVANNALVRQASIGDDTVVGYSTEVKGSILGDHVWSHMSYIGDSVFGYNTACGAGAIAGNLRLDETKIKSAIGQDKICSQRTKLGAVIGSGCRLGINVTMDPGVKIGSGTFISSSTYLNDDVPDSSYVIIKNGQLEIRQNRTVAPEPENRDQYRRQQFSN